MSTGLSEYYEFSDTVYKTPIKQKLNDDMIENDVKDSINIDPMSQNIDTCYDCCNQANEAPIEGFEAKSLKIISPFVKHLDKLSPLCKKNGGFYKRQKVHNDDEFSAEFMKTPIAHKLEVADSRNDFCQSISLDLGSNGFFSFNDPETPSLDSNHECDINIDKFGFSFDKENVEANMERDQENIHQYKCDNGKESRTILKKRSRHENKSEISDKKSQLNEANSGGSTSPGSNVYAKNDQPKTSTSQNDRNKVFIAQFSISKKHSDNMLSIAIGTDKRKLNRRNEKSSYKNFVDRDESISRDSSGKATKGCTCKKSQCKKLYCECFQNKTFCGPDCSCIGCVNTIENAEMIAELRKAIIKRNPNAFKDVQKATTENKHVKGCRCKKSKCVTGYCECHQLGAKCSELCQCVECNNQPISDSLLMQQK